MSAVKYCPKEAGVKQNRIIERGPLHNSDGLLACSGYATSPLLDYRRSSVGAPRLRFKEWDYYLINDDEFAVALTLGDLGYAGLVSASVVDLVEHTYRTDKVVVPFPLKKCFLPECSDGGVSSFENKRACFKFAASEGVRKIQAWFAKFCGGKDLYIEAVLDEEPEDSMVIATPLAEDPPAFCYNRKIVAMRARGSFKIGYDIHGFRPEDSLGLLNWGRGVWKCDTTWYWASAQGFQESGEKYVNPRRIGLNLGYGLAEASGATENAIFYDGKAYKLGIVGFDIPEKRIKPESAQSVYDRCEIMQPWRMADTEGKLDLVFTPWVDRYDCLSAGLITGDRHQVFGSYSGTVSVGDTELHVENLRGFVEITRSKQ